MGTAGQFSKMLHEHTAAYAAWLPVANRFELGDYGIIGDGVFQRLGHLREFGVEFDSGGPSPAAPINLTSQSTRVVRLVGGAEVNALPDAPIEASLRIEFGEEASFLLKAAEVSVTEISNVRQVAEKLAKADGWKRQWRVVRSLWTASGSAIAISSGNGGTLELSGKANVLKELDLGTASVDVSVSTEDNVGFSSIGKTGVVGLGLFKLKRFRGGPRLLGAEERAEYEEEGNDELESDL